MIAVRLPSRPAAALRAWSASWATLKHAMSRRGPTRRPTCRGAHRVTKTSFARWIASMGSRTCRRAPVRGANGCTQRPLRRHPFLSDVSRGTAPRRRRSLARRSAAARARRETDLLSDTSSVTDEDLASAPDLQVGPNSVRLVGSDYRIQLDLPAGSGGPRARGDLVVRAMTGCAIPPFTMRGAGGWVSGYVVPVPSGELTGTMAVGTEQIEFRNATAYHDHNWGFWEGVRWQWGQVQGEGLSFVYGRVYPPADAADGMRVPGISRCAGARRPRRLRDGGHDRRKTNATPTSLLLPASSLPATARRWR